MSTHLTNRGRWLFGSSLVFLTAGTVAIRPALVALGAVQLCCLLVAYLLGLRGALVLDRRLVEVTFAGGDESGSGSGRGGVVGVARNVQVAVSNPSIFDISEFELDPFSPEQLDVELDESRRSIDAGETREWTATVRARQSGRWVLQGFDVRAVDPLGLTRNRDYLGACQPFEFYPNVGRLRSSSSRRRRGRQSHQKRIQPDRSGTEIRELRDYQPGDPLHHVAWKATAKNQRLISREFDDDVGSGLMILLDMSASMRGGSPQGDKLEHAVEMVASLADARLQQRRRVGLVTFDEDIYGYLPMRDHQTHYRRILRHLVGLKSVVAHQLTELDDAELAEVVADYLIVQERLDFRRGSDGDRVNLSLLKRWLDGRMSVERERYDSPVLTEGVTEEVDDVVREFTRLRGLPIPYRAESRLGRKSQGLADGLEMVASRAPSAQQIVIISDLCGLTHLDLVERGLGLAQKKGHQLRCYVPFTPAYHRPELEESELGDILVELFSAAEREERRDGIEFLRARGVDVEVVGPGEFTEDAAGSS
jgi:uncharacterized protein (DUF58 family)